MTYKLYVERYAQKQILKLDKKAIPIIKSAIAGLAENKELHTVHRFHRVQPGGGTCRHQPGNEADDAGD